MNPFLSFIFPPFFLSGKRFFYIQEMMMADGGRWLTFFSLVQKVPQRISPLYRPHIHNNICPPGASPQLSIAEENLYSQTCVILSMKEYISNFGYCRYVSNMRDGSPPPSVPVWLAVKILFVVLAFFSFF